MIKNIISALCVLSVFVLGSLFINATLPYIVADIQIKADKIKEMKLKETNDDK